LRGEKGFGKAQRQQEKRRQKARPYGQSLVAWVDHPGRPRSYIHNPAAVIAGGYSCTRLKTGVNEITDVFSHPANCN
jgi:hypothetical protein